MCGHASVARGDHRRDRWISSTTTTIATTATLVDVVVRNNHPSGKLVVVVVVIIVIVIPSSDEHVSTLTDRCGINWTLNRTLLDGVFHHRFSSQPPSLFSGLARSLQPPPFFFPHNSRPR